MARYRRRHHRRSHRRGMHGLGDIGALGEYPPVTSPKEVTFNGRSYTCYGKPLMRRGKAVPPQSMNGVVCVPSERAGVLTDEEVTAIRQNLPEDYILKLQRKAFLKKAAAQRALAASGARLARRMAPSSAAAAARAGVAPSMWAAIPAAPAPAASTPAGSQQMELPLRWGRVRVSRGVYRDAQGRWRGASGQYIRPPRRGSGGYYG